MKDLMDACFDDDHDKCKCAYVVTCACHCHEGSSMRHDDRARFRCSTIGTSLEEVRPKLHAEADEVIGKNNWKAVGPIEMTLDSQNLAMRDRLYEATLDVIALD